MSTFRIKSKNASNFHIFIAFKKNQMFSRSFKNYSPKYLVCVNKFQEIRWLFILCATFAGLTGHS